MSAKMHALENLAKADYRNIQNQTEELQEKTNSAFYFKVKKGTH